MYARTHPVEQFAADIVEEFREEITILEKRGLRDAAQLLHSLTEDILSWAQAWLDHPLTLREAASLAGCSYSTMQARVRAGDIPNVGKKGAPRVCRRDIPFRGSPGLVPYGDGPVASTSSEPDDNPVGPISRGDDDDPGLDLVDLKLLSFE